MYGTDAILLALSGDDIVIDMRPVQQARSVHIQWQQNSVTLTSLKQKLKSK